MLNRSFYELLPYGYMAVASTSLMVLESSFAHFCAIVLFVLGARVYSLRSQNRRTDPVKRRKTGNIPNYLYELMPFLYVLTALAIFKYLPQKMFLVAAICLLGYGFYILFSRSLYRHHRLPVTPFF